MKRALPFILLSVCLALLLGACGAQPVRSPAFAEEPAASDAAEPTATPSPAPTPEPEPIRCTVVACGDVVPHWELLQEAFSKDTDEYDFAPMLSGVEPFLSEADYAFCTTECAFVEKGFSAYPSFRTPAALLKGLQEVGFDMICLASNHCCDAKLEGVFSSIDACEALGLDHTGTYRTQEERETDRGILFRDINGIEFAFIDYTSITNQHELYDNAWAVRTLFRDYFFLEPKQLLYDEIDEDIEYARACGADIVIVICHWGYEYATVPAAYQTELAERMIEDGADIIIGSHPHVLQPATVYSYQDCGVERNAYVFYSLGNFFTGMTNELGNISPCVRMQFEKDPESGLVTVSAVDYSLLYRAALSRRPDDGGPLYRLLDADTPADALPEWLSPSLGSAMQTVRQKALSVLGEELYIHS